MKRHFSEGCDDGSEFARRGSKQPFKFATVLKEVLNGPSLPEFVSKLKPFIQEVVCEEVEHAISSYLRSSLAQPEPSEVKAWQLHFENPLPPALFTSSRIESEDRKPVKIVIQDSHSNKVITSGPLSSSKIEIVVLDGDFGAGDQDEWTEKEFSAKILRERQGKRPLVTGDLVITLRDGVGYLGNVSFTDNSSWIRSRKFRLGARVQNLSSTGRIREAISEAFVVKDHRGESYKKHHPPHWNDEVWRLEKIAKDGALHTRLAKQGISSVKDFLRLYITNPNSLRNLIGGGISNKTWEIIIGHATDCILDDDEFYMYYQAAERTGLLFNSIFKVVAAIDGENRQPLDKLNVFQLRSVEVLKQRAYKNLNDLVLIDDPSIIGHPVLFPSSQGDHPFSSPSFDLQNLKLPVTDQDQQEMQSVSYQMTTSPVYAYEVGSSSQLDFSKAQNCHPLQVWSPTITNSFILRESDYEPFGGAYNYDSNEYLGTVALTGPLATNDGFSQVYGSMLHENELFLAPSSQAFDIVTSNYGFQISSNGSPSSRWCKIRAAITWGISVRRTVAAKKRARLH